MKLALFVAFALAGAWLTAPGLAADKPAKPRQSACVSLGAGGFGNVPTPLKPIAHAVDHDPSEIWSDGEIWNPNGAGRTDIWEARLRTCEGELVISQLVNRQCWSAWECPARVVMLAPGGEAKALIAYRQVCSHGETFAVGSDGLRACDRLYPLR